MTIAAINLFRREVLTEAGEVLPITNLFDADGDETTDTTEAVTFVAGAGNRWYTDLCKSYEQGPSQ